MLSERLLNVIDRTWVGSFLDRKFEDINKTDPDNIYVENIRSFFGVSSKMARRLCEMAVWEGVFAKRVGYFCPIHGQVIRSVPDGETPPDEMVCQLCELSGEEDPYSSSDLDTIEIYSLTRGR